MLNIGPGEILVIALIALIVVGPEQLPAVLRRIGKTAGSLRHMADGLKKDFMSGMDELDPNKWTETPRGKGSVTDPIIGPGAYGPPIEDAPAPETEAETPDDSVEPLEDGSETNDEEPSLDGPPEPGNGDEDLA